VYLKIVGKKLRRDFPTTEQGKEFISVSCMPDKSVFETGHTIDNYYSTIQGISEKSWGKLRRDFPTTEQGRKLISV
jgi:hypothetical protein